MPGRRSTLRSIEILTSDWSVAIHCRFILGTNQGAEAIDVHIATTHNNANTLTFKLIGHLLLNVIVT